MVGDGRDLYGSSSPTPCRSRVTYSRLYRTLSRRVLNISREGESTPSLGNMFQCFRLAMLDSEWHEILKLYPVLWNYN